MATASNAQLNSGKHTPGPWRVHPEDGAIHRWVIAHESGLSVGECSPGSQSVSPEEADANARPIAAAPDLLAALIECRRMILSGTAHPDEYVSVLDAAIARAEGGAA